MKVSVIIPAYNAARTIRTTLDSVLIQTCPADEILVMDDGSTDETPEILESYKSSVQVLRQDNKGVAAARNELYARAAGDFIAFLDSDDIWHPSYLQTQTALLDAHPQAVLFFTGHVNFDGCGDFRWMDETLRAPDQVQVLSAIQFFNRNWKAPGPFGTSFCCASKSALSEVLPELAPVTLRTGETDICSAWRHLWAARSYTVQVHWLLTEEPPVHCPRTRRGCTEILLRPFAYSLPSIRGKQAPSFLAPSI